MGTAEKGVIAAGHPLTAEAGARVLREGGNAVDAAVAAMLTSFVTEGLLTGLGAGGYMLVGGAGVEPVMLDFFVAAPTRLGDGSEADLLAVDVSFGDAAQVFHIGPASCGVYGAPSGICEAMRRWGSLPLQQLAEPAARLARDGVPLNAAQAYVAEILADLLTSTPECAALWAPGGALLREGQTLRNPDLADALLRLGSEGAEPFYRGDIAGSVCDWLFARGGSLSREDLAGYGAIERAPVRIVYRDREVLTNPPPAAGGTLLAYALALLNRDPSPPCLEAIVRAMAAAQAERTPAFLDGLALDGFAERFMSSRLGSTTHIAVIDADGLACSTTSTNGEGSGVVGPGTGMHLNNVMGEQDGAPRRDARGRGRAGARQRRLQPHPLGAAADDHRHRRPWDGGRGSCRGAAGAFRGRDRVCRARHRPERAGAPPGRRVLWCAQPLLWRCAGRAATRRRDERRGRSASWRGGIGSMG